MRCDAGYVRESDLGGTAADSPEAERKDDDWWICPRCSASRPVVYVLGRQMRNFR